MKAYHAPAMLALCGLAVLPGCSMMSMHRPASQTSTAAPMTRPELAPEMVTQVQTSLQQQGVYKGPIDGLWGSETQKALQSYQQSHNLAANGQLDSPTLASLKLSDTTPDSTTSVAPTSSPAPAPAPTTTQ